MHWLPAKAIDRLPLPFALLPLSVSFVDVSCIVLEHFGLADSIGRFVK